MMNHIDISRIDLNLLALFEVVFRERHLGRTADRLNLTNSAVSHGVGRLRRLLNDPLFIRHPRGVAPTERAEALAPAIADILDRVRGVLAAAEPFDPARSARRFVVGVATDGIGSVVLPPLLAALRREAPHVDLRTRPVTAAAAAAALDARNVDVAVVPAEETPARFATRTLYEEDFVVAMRDGHPLGPAPTLERYCDALHLLVSPAGDDRGFVDKALESRGLSRRVVLTSQSFFLALAVVAATDLVAALPRRQLTMHGRRFGVVHGELPLPLGQFAVHAVAPRAAVSDAGLAWLLDIMARTQPVSTQP